MTELRKKFKMTNQEIRDKAPVGATGYFEHTKNYLKNKNGTWCVWVKDEWVLVKQMTYLNYIRDSIKPLLEWFFIACNFMLLSNKYIN